MTNHLKNAVNLLLNTLKIVTRPFTSKTYRTFRGRLGEANIPRAPHAVLIFSAMSCASGETFPINDTFSQLRHSYLLQESKFNQITSDHPKDCTA